MQTWVLQYFTHLDAVDGAEEEDVSEANIFVSEASKPSAEASEILV